MNPNSIPNTSNKKKTPWQFGPFKKKGQRVRLRHPEGQVSHSPVTALYDDRGRLIGWVCEHCASLMTRSGQWSKKEKQVGDAFKANKAHKARKKAAARRRFRTPGYQKPTGRKKAA